MGEAETETETMPRKQYRVGHIWLNYVKFGSTFMDTKMGSIKDFYLAPSFTNTQK